MEKKGLFLLPLALLVIGGLTGCEMNPFGNNQCSIEFVEFEKAGTLISLQTSDLKTSNIEVESVETEGIYTSLQGIRFSSRKDGGKLVFNFKKEVLITNVTLTVVQYSPSDTSTVKVSANGNETEIESQIVTGEMSFDFSEDSIASKSLSFVASEKNRFYLSKISFALGKVVPIYPTALSLDEDFEIAIDKTRNLKVTYTPKNTNQRDVTYSSSDVNVATVSDSGVVKGVSNGVAIITASTISEGGKTISTQTRVTVTDTPKDLYTILVYMCGSDLESSSGLATADLTEILSVECPEEVNIVIETGGASKWNSKYGISKSEHGRYHVDGKSLTKVGTTANNRMGYESTLESFLTWGLNEYPACKTGLILWNHGGGMSGVCFEDTSNAAYADGLTAAEVGRAVAKSMTTCGINEKLEWIGYDACIMNVADIATVNSQYFNYMVASQESEAGEGWVYDEWLSTLYSNPLADSKTILSKICTSFVEENGGTRSNNDQCLSVLDLSVTDELVEKFEAYSQALNVKSSNEFLKIKTSYTASSTLKFGEGYYGLADFKLFLKGMDSRFSDVSSEEVKEVISRFVIVNKYGGAYSSSKVPCGVNLFVAVSSGYYDLQVSKSDYTANDTMFSTWRNININYSTGWVY